MEQRDTQAKAELITGKPQADPCRRAEPLEGDRRDETEAHLGGTVCVGPSVMKET